MWWLVGAVVLFFLVFFEPYIEYIKRSETLVLWFNGRNNKREYIIIWKN